MTQDNAIRYTSCFAVSLYAVIIPYCVHKYAEHSNFGYLTLTVIVVYLKYGYTIIESYLKYLIMGTIIFFPLFHHPIIAHS